MYKSNIYSGMALLVSFFVLGFSSLYAQLELKLQLMDEDTWGVYVRPAAGVTPASSTITGSGQVTVVMPKGFNWTALSSVSGLWQDDAIVYGPAENPTRQYVSFGLVQAEPNYPIYYTAGAETLLFTFDRVGPCPDTIYLMDCGTPTESDPYCPPNSLNDFPGNDLSVIEFNGGITFYNYTGNYSPDVPDNCTGGDPTTPVLEEWNDVASFTLSPNPASHRLQIEFLNEKINANGKIRLWTAQGISLREEDWEGQPTVSLDVNELPAGMYFLSFESEGKVLQRERFIKR